VWIHDVVLPPGEWTLIALHPSDSAVVVRTDSTGLEICPGDAFGDESFGIGFTGLTCAPVNGTYATPQRPGGHVAFGLRNATQEARTIPEIEVRYTASDTFFFAVFPPLAVGRISPTLQFVPNRDTVIGAKVYLTGFRAAPVEAELTQKDLRLPMWSTRYSGDGDPFGPATLNESVTVRTTNTTQSPLDRYALFVAWA